MSYSIANSCEQLLGLIIREVFRVPADFRHGVVIACAFSNWGNLPVAVVQTVAKNEPFDAATDPMLGVAYVSVFILIVSVDESARQPSAHRCSMRAVQHLLFRPWNVQDLRLGLCGGCARERCVAAASVEAALAGRAEVGGKEGEREWRRGPGLEQAVDV